MVAAVASATRALGMVCIRASSTSEKAMETTMSLSVFGTIKTSPAVAMPRSESAEMSFMMLSLNT